MTETTTGPPSSQFSPEGWEALASSGLFRTLSSQSLTDGQRLKEALARIRTLGKESTDRGLTFSAVTQLASTIYCLRIYGTKEAKERYLPAAEAGQSIGGHAITEENAGSDVMNMASTATFLQDHYVLNGTKKFITNAPIADTLVVYAKMQGGPCHGALSAFLIETSWSGVEISAPMPTAGLQSSPLGEVVLRDVSVPASNRIGHEGAGLLILDQVMKREIVLAFAASIGEIERSIAGSIDHVNTRHQFGTSIGTNQLVANRIVESQIAVELGAALLESITEKLDGFDDVTIPVSAAKIFISEARVTTALNAIQVRGGKGYLSPNDQTQDLLDAVPGTIYSGSNDLLRSKIATLIGVTT